MEKLFRNKAKDERVVAETNRIYRIGYHILCFGILADLVLKYSGAMPAWLDGENKLFSLEFWVLLAANAAIVVLMVRRGMMDDNAYAEAETFPLRHYAGVAVLAGLAAGVVYAVLSWLGGGYWEGLDAGSLLLVMAVMTVSITVCTGPLILLIYYACFRAAKKRRQAQREDEDFQE